LKTVRRYNPSDATLWNDFVGQSKNATFLFHRDYMDYHADRFMDHSLLVYDNEEVAALFAANESDGSIVSHGGLTYGGLMLRDTARLEDVLGYVHHVLNYYDRLGIKEIVYKCFPQYLARYPSQEDLYALFLAGAQLSRRDTNCVYHRDQALPYQHNRKRAIAKAHKENLRVTRTHDPTKFWNDILVPNLQDRHGVRPVHSLEEIRLLMSRFPAHIHLFEVADVAVLGGTLIFEMPNAIHAQYIASSPEGKDKGALDLLFHELITGIYQEKAFVSFGISNEQNGKILNRGLMNWKEGFGARTVIADSYVVKTANFPALAAYA
jgi:hypothetical protein